MTTEDDFQRQLDEHPEDYQTRVVLADWLEEHGDPRAEWYRALGAKTRIPDVLGSFWYYHNAENASPDTYMACTLAVDWFEATAPGRINWTPGYASRREAEDAAALAFAKLPTERRAELLTAGVSA